MEFKLEFLFLAWRVQTYYSFSFVYIKIDKNYFFSSTQ